MLFTKVCVGFSSVDCVSSPKFQAYVKVLPPGSYELDDRKLTNKADCPLVGLACISAIGFNCSVVESGEFTHSISNFLVPKIDEYGLINTASM